MRTSDQPDEITPLPPPPAPTARDANPWQVSGAPAPARRARMPQARDAGSRPARSALRHLVAIGIVAFIAVSGAVEALRGGEPEKLIGVAFTVFILLIFFLARQRSARRRAGRPAGPGQPGR